MKTRIATGAVLVLVLLLLLFVLPPFTYTLFISFMSMIGAYELLHKTNTVPKHPFLYFSCAAAFLVPLVLSTGELFSRWFLTVMTGYTIIAFIFAVTCHEKLNFSAVSKGIVASVIFPAMLSAVVRIAEYAPEGGRELLLLPWVAVWVCDSGALLTGMAFGKHKLAPYVSPKKTVEGFIGGEILATAAVALLVFIVNKRAGTEVVSMLTAVLYGIFGAAAGQFGDLSLSVIKRESGIKDYGKIFPGHGGVWDRFDSVLFAAPVFELVMAFTNRL